MLPIHDLFRAEHLSILEYYQDVLPKFLVVKITRITGNGILLLDSLIVA